MAERSQDRGERSPAREDQIIQQAVLLHVVTEHPTQLTVNELISELVVGREDFRHTDGIERAVRDLVGVGLLHRQGEFVQPSRAALCSYDLWEG
jgi:hypothetical protein